MRLKRLFVDLAQVCSRQNLNEAVWRAAKGKSRRPDVQAFLADLEQNLTEMSRAIELLEVPLAPLRYFQISDPKTRTIAAAGFADRVIHHAIMGQIGRTMERGQIQHSYACLPHRGVHKAVLQVQKNLRAYPWVVQVDVQHYFACIDQAILHRLLARRFKGREFMVLLHRIIQQQEDSPGKGLPIGALTSQYFANHYLLGADQMMIDDPQVKGYVRYMDDIIWCCYSPDQAKETRDQLQRWLQQERQLQLKPKLILNRSRHGVSYCGYRIKPGQIRLSRRRMRRFKQHRQRWEQAYAQGDIGARELQLGYAAVNAITDPAQSLGFRRQNLLYQPPVDA